MFTEIQREKLSVLHFFIDGTNDTLDIEKSLSSNLGLGLFSQLLVNSNMNFSDHILLALKRAFASNKKLYNKDLKVFNQLYFQNLSRSTCQTPSLRSSHAKENDFDHPMKTPKKQKKLEFNPKSAKIMPSRSRETPYKNALSEAQEKHAHSALSEKKLGNHNGPPSLNNIFNDNVSISSGSELNSELR